jgi:hypothetical protein
VSAAGQLSIYRAIAERAPGSFRRDPPPCPVAKCIPCNRFTFSEPKSIL